MNAEQRRRLRQKIDAGMKAAVAAALEEHRRAGRPVAVLRAGRVVLAQPDVIESFGSLVAREEPPGE
jgi:urease gamma subunit